MLRLLAIQQPIRLGCSLRTTGPIKGTAFIQSQNTVPIVENLLRFSCRMAARTKRRWNSSTVLVAWFHADDEFAVPATTWERPTEY